MRLLKSLGLVAIVGMLIPAQRRSPGRATGTPESPRPRSHQRSTKTRKTRSTRSRSLQRLRSSALPLP